MIQATGYTNTQTTITPEMQLADALNQILRGEMSAVEAYKQGIEKIEGDAEKKRLNEFLAFHQRNVDYWWRQVAATSMKPDTSSGPWGAVVKAFMGTAKLFGEVSTLKALKKGEEHGLSEYKDLLENNFIEEADKRFVRETIIPEFELHLASIDAMMNLH